VALAEDMATRKAVEPNQDEAFPAGGASDGFIFQLQYVDYSYIRD
jgi:hypothetical protein